MAWDSMASPTLFAVVGDALPPAKRTMGFTVQSILRRLPIVIAPTIGGFAVAAYGIQGGVRVGLVVSMIMAAITAGVVFPTSHSDHFRSRSSHNPPCMAVVSFRSALAPCFGRVHPDLRRAGRHLSRSVRAGRHEDQRSELRHAHRRAGGNDDHRSGPAAHLAARAGKKPFVTATFVAFALFPLAVVLAPSFTWLVAAFVVGGLRDVGEPARKALIVDFAAPAMRGRVVGLYYLCRSVAIAPAAFIGGLLWRVNPALPFYLATLIGFAGAVAFVATVKE